MQKLLYKLATNMVWTGLYLRRLLDKKAHSENTFVRPITLGDGAIRVGRSVPTTKLLEQLPKRLPSQERTKAIREAVQSLALGSCITEETKRPGLKGFHNSKSKLNQLN